METISYQTPAECLARVNRANNPATLAGLRLIVADKAGNPRLFNLYTYAPFFNEQHKRHWFSACGRFVVYPQKTIVAGEPITVKGQYHVYYFGNPVPEDRYSTRSTIREKHYRPKTAHKHTGGIDPSWR